MRARATEAVTYIAFDQGIFQNENLSPMIHQPDLFAETHAQLNEIVLVRFVMRERSQKQAPLVFNMNNWRMRYSQCDDAGWSSRNYTVYSLLPDMVNLNTPLYALTPPCKR